MKDQPTDAGFRDAVIATAQAMGVLWVLFVLAVTGAHWWAAEADESAQPCRDPGVVFGCVSMSNMDFVHMLAWLGLAGMLALTAVAVIVLMVAWLVRAIARRSRAADRTA